MKRLRILTGLICMRLRQTVHNMFNYLASLICLSLALAALISGLSVYFSKREAMPYYRDNRDRYQIVDNLESTNLAKFIIALENNFIEFYPLLKDQVDISYDSSIPEEDRAYNKLLMPLPTVKYLGLGVDGEGEYSSKKFQELYVGQEAMIISDESFPEFRIIEFTNWNRTMIQISSEINWERNKLGVVLIPRAENQVDRAKQADILFKLAKEVDYKLNLKTEVQHLEGALRTVYVPYSWLLYLGAIFLCLQIFYFISWQIALQEKLSENLARHYLSGRSETQECILICSEILFILGVSYIIGCCLARLIVLEIPSYFFVTRISWQTNLIIILILLSTALFTIRRRYKMARIVEVLTCIVEEN